MAKIMYMGQSCSGVDFDFDTMVSDFKGATTSVAGTRGVVPAPAKGTTTRVLTANGKWTTLYTIATDSEVQELAQVVGGGDSTSDFVMATSDDITQIINS